MTDNDLNEQVNVTVDDASVITVPIDATLQNSNEAADAKAVGDALALKADKSELQAAVKVNNQPADAQGLILIDGRHIPVSDQDTETLANAVTDLKGKTAADIPMSSDSGAKTIAEVVNANSEAIEGMEEMTGATMPIESGSQTTVKAAIEARVKTVNRKAPDADGDVDLSVVPLAENLQSDKMESVEGSFIIRTTGGNASVSDGKAYPLHLFGSADHAGYVAEQLNMTVIPIARTEPDEPITATIDRDTFVAYVDESSTINLYYTTEWSADPELYGITVTGTPEAGDQITVVYVKEVRGTITVANPARLVGTGWNLFDYNNGYARVVKYSTEYGYKIGGSYASLQFSATLTGERSSITPGVDGLFNVPSDGYVFVTGGNNTDTYILTTWSDWMEGPSSGYWEPYRESGIDLSAVMTTYFPNGLLAVGTTRDEIDLSAKRSISRIERMAYSEENRAAAAASGRSYDFDQNYIYIVRESAVISAITIDTTYNVSEHGLEWFTETTLPVISEILYGKNLRDKLERDVVTISAQTLTEEEKAQVRTNIGAMSQADGDKKLVAPTTAGTAGQLLHLKADGGTEWTTQGTPTDAQVGTAVSAWLTAHPEATTTVEDGAISRAKLNDDLKAKTDAVPDLKSAFDALDDSFYKYQSSVFDTRSGTSTAKDKRILINVDNPIPNDIFIGNLKLIGDNNLTGTVVIELATLSDGTYTVYDSLTKSITAKEYEQANLVIGKKAIGETYVFITISVAYVFHVMAVTGKKMVASDTTTGTSFTTRVVNNYELPYQIYCSISDAFVEGILYQSARIDRVTGRVDGLEESFFKYQSSVFAYESGTSTVKDRRLLLNVENPIPDGIHIGNLKLIGSGSSPSGTIKVELATLLNGTYTVYDSVSKEVTPIIGVASNIINIDKIANGNTYVFITLSVGYMFHVAEATGKKVEYSDTITGTTFTTSVTNNYELVFQLYCSCSDALIDKINNDIYQLQINAVGKDNVVSYISGNGFKLIEQSQLIDGHYCKYNTGEVMDNDSYTMTPLIPVFKNMQIQVTGGAQGSQVAYYKANGDYAEEGALVRTSTSITVPNNNNIAYMRWCTLIENKSSASLVIYEREIEDTVYVDTTKGILEGVMEAYSKGLKKVVVYAGEYDVLDEYEDYFGSDCWDNYVETGYNNAAMGVYGRGIWIDNLEITFMPGSKVIAHYTGSNAAVKKMFSPFAVGSDASIIGLVVDSSELRYCIHPDFHPRTYETLLFKDCDLHHLKGDDWNEAIGCGFGDHSYWTFDNCIFRSDGNYRVFRIHNASPADVQSKAIVKNCYVEGEGYMSFNNHGASTLVSTVEVYGCSWINPARVGSEIGAQNENMSMLAWNNETRQS